MTCHPAAAEHPVVVDPPPPAVYLAFLLAKSSCRYSAPSSPAKTGLGPDRKCAIGRAAAREARLKPAE